MIKILKQATAKKLSESYKAFLSVVKDDPRHGYMWPMVYCESYDAEMFVRTVCGGIYAEDTMLITKNANVFFIRPTGVIVFDMEVTAKVQSAEAKSNGVIYNDGGIWLSVNN